MARLMLLTVFFVGVALIPCILGQEEADNIKKKDITETHPPTSTTTKASDVGDDNDENNNENEMPDIRFIEKDGKIYDISVINDLLDRYDVKGQSYDEGDDKGGEETGEGDGERDEATGEEGAVDETGDDEGDVDNGYVDDGSVVPPAPYGWIRLPRIRRVIRRVVRTVVRVVRKVRVRRIWDHVRRVCRLCYKPLLGYWGICCYNIPIGKKK